jgi:NAD(P)H-dependent FMN reductase/DNA-binding MarR family transcriptional regulator
VTPAPDTTTPGDRGAPDLGIVDGLVQTSFTVHSILSEVAAEHRVSLVQARLLGILRDREPRMAQLAHVLGLTKSSATGLIDRAERRGLVRRTTIPVGDERAVHVALTERGRELIDGLAERVGRRLAALVEELTDTDRRRLSRLLTQLVIRDGDLQSVDPRPVDPRPVDPRPVDPRPVDPRPVDPRPAGEGERIAVIVASNRPRRICPAIAGWVRETLQERGALRYELVDLAAIDLPFLDEPLMPALGGYAHEHTRAWSRLVSGYRGFVFVFPQYNWGYPAVLKNALDFLYDEWRDKPAASVTYGTRGGSRAAGQLQQVLAGLHMRPLAGLEVIVTKDDLDPDWQLHDVRATMAPYLDQTRELDAQMLAAVRGAATAGRPAPSPGRRSPSAGR